MGYRIVLTADRSLTSEYRHVPLLDFLACAPSERVPEFLFDFLAPQVPHHDGILPYAPYGLRKVEAALLRDYKRSDVVVAHPDHVERFIDEKTKIVGINTMDPLSLGPLSLGFTGGVFKSYSQKFFLDLIYRLNHLREKHGYKFKITVGGPGALYLSFRPHQVEQLNIDYVIVGEIDHMIPYLFHEMEDDGLPRISVFRKGPRIEEIPDIVNPSIHGLVEVMRGCGRGCEFCEPNLRYARYMPIEKIVREIKVNTAAGLHNAWVHSEDIFLYQLEDWKTFMPNTDALVELFTAIMSIPGIRHSNPTHGTIAPAVAEPEMISKLSKILRASHEHWIGIQTGLETGSGQLLWNYMRNKMKPFSPDEWFDVVINGTAILNQNYWFPAFTLIIGLPGETEEDAWETVRLIDAMERYLPRVIGEKAHFTVTPLFFSPLGVLKGEEFFDIEELNEGQMAVIYRAWRHIMIELNNLPPKLIKLNPPLKLAFKLIAKFGAWAVINYIKWFAKRKGFDVDKFMRVRAEKRPKIEVIAH